MRIRRMRGLGCLGCLPLGGLLPLIAIAALVYWLVTRGKPTAVAPPAAQPPPAQPPGVPGVGFCSHCGKPLDAGSSFCRYCGAQAG